MIRFSGFNKDLNTISGVKTTMKANKGFTLLEVAVVLAIIAILAAILTPVVTSYIDQARITRADNDVKKIAEAINLFKRDTGVFPPYLSYSAATAGSSPVTCLVSGTAAVTTSANIFTGGAAWNCGTTTASIGLLQDYLNVTSGIASSIPFTGEAVGGRVAYRGPYLDGVQGTDPWGNPYVVNSGNLTASFTNYAFAISAGPNGVLNTTQTQAKTAAFAVTTDDVAALIR
jgi:prepilin-type N-terminal cleavage/methylation domain-containing protein